MQLTGYLKTNSVGGRGAGLWMRVDGNDDDILGFDNMFDQRIQGTTDWAPHHIILDVLDRATAIAFGLLLDGPSQAWVDDIALTVLGGSVPTATRPVGPSHLPDRPTNPNFES